MTKICTDIEQSKKLIELGIDRNSSDCSWILSPRNGHYILSLTAPLDDDIPAWSLAALLKLIPIPILSTINDRFCCETYEFNSKYYDEPVDAAYEVVAWLKENGKI